MTEREYCESTLRNLMMSAKLAYECIEDEAYKALRKAFDKPRVLNAIAKTLADILGENK